MRQDKRGWLPFWPIPVGSIFGIRLSLSVWFLFLIPLFCLWYGLRLGLSLSAVMVFAALVHEAARIAASVWSQESVSRSLLWPAGGLIHASEPQARIRGACAGVGANLFVCLLTALPLMQSGQMAKALDPLMLNNFQLGVSPTDNVIYLLFVVNWAVALVNLLPLTPFAAGVIYRDLTLKLFGRENGELIWRRSCWCSATILMLSGLVLELSLVVAIAAICMLALMNHSVQTQPSHLYEPPETFLGYDFSEGYTSLNRSQTASPYGSLIQQWRVRREQQRREREAEIDLEVAEHLDRILDQVHQNGVESLSHEDRKRLDRASERFRERSSVPESTPLDA